MSISQINKNQQCRRVRVGQEQKMNACAWLHASEDPITGTGQKKDLFWNTIVRQFIKLLPAGELSATECSTSSMQTRWVLINKEFIILLLVEFILAIPPHCLGSLPWPPRHTQEFHQLSAIFFTLQGTYTRYRVGAYRVDDPVCGKFLQGQVMSTL